MLGFIVAPNHYIEYALAQGGGQGKSHGHDDDFSPTRGKWTDHPTFFLFCVFPLVVRPPPQFFPIFLFFPPLFQTPTP